MTILLPLIFFAAFSSAATPTPETTTTATNATDFIRRNCDTTLYPQLCFHSLARYANAVQQNPARLARVAVGLSLSRAKRTSLYIANISSRADYGADPRASSALHDCFTVMGDAVDQIRGSARQMRRLSGSREEVRFQLGNVQTWMSAALTNEDTCVDGFEDVEDGAVKVEVCDRVVVVKEVTSSALALVNSFVAKVVGP